MAKFKRDLCTFNFDLEGWTPTVDFDSVRPSFSTAAVVLTMSGLEACSVMMSQLKMLIFVSCRPG